MNKEDTGNLLFKLMQDYNKLDKQHNRLKKLAKEMRTSCYKKAMQKTNVLKEMQQLTLDIPKK